MGYASPIEIWEPFEPKVDPDDTYTGIRFLFPQTIAIVGSIGAATVTAGDAFTRIEIVLQHEGDPEDEDVVGHLRLPGQFRRPALLRLERPVHHSRTSMSKTATRSGSTAASRGWS